MLVAALLSVLALLAGRACAELTLFDDTDARFEWQPEQVLDRATCSAEQTDSNECIRHWWTEGTTDDHWSTIHETRGPNTSVSFRFTGPEFRVYGLKLVAGAYASVTIDGVRTGMINSTSTAGLTEHQAELCAVSGLNSSREHEVVIEYYFAGHWHNQSALSLGIDYFLIDVSHEHSLTSSSETTSSASTSTAVPHESITPSTPTGTQRAASLTLAQVASIIAFTVTAVLAGLLVCGVFLLRRRRASRRRLSGTGPLPGSTTSSIGIESATAPPPSPLLIYTRGSSQDSFTFHSIVAPWKPKK